MKLIDKDTLIAEIKKLMDKLYDKLPNASKVENGTITASEICNTGKDLEEAAKFYADTHTEWFDADGNPHVAPAFKAGAKWQKGKDEYITDDLGEYISELSKQFPEVSFAKLSRIAVRVAKWKEEQFENNRLKHCNSITNEQAELEQGFIDQHLDKYRRMPTFLDAIEYGMRLQKQKTMTSIM